MTPLVQISHTNNKSNVLFTSQAILCKIQFHVAAFRVQIWTNLANLSWLQWSFPLSSTILVLRLKNRWNKYQDLKGAMEIILLIRDTCRSQIQGTSTESGTHIHMHQSTSIVNNCKLSCTAQPHRSFSLCSSLVESQTLAISCSKTSFSWMARVYFFSRSICWINHE